MIRVKIHVSNNSLLSICLLIIDAGTVRLVAQRFNHYATPGPKQQWVKIIKLIKGREAIEITNKTGKVRVT